MLLYYCWILNKHVPEAKYGRNMNKIYFDLE